MTNDTKDCVQYGSAVSMVASGIVLAFLSFFLNEHDIESGVLMYVAEALVYAGGIFGVSLYFKTKLGDFESHAADRMEGDLRRAVRDILKEEQAATPTEEDPDGASPKPQSPKPQSPNQ